MNSSVICIPSTSYYATPEFLTQTVHIITAISFPIHLLGLYIIIFKTPKAMVSVKWYLLHVHTWIVIYDNSLGVLTVPFLLFPSMGGYSLGLLAYFGVHEFLMVVLVLLTCINVLLSILAVFENRYFIICVFPPKPTWEKCRRPWLIAHYLMCIVIFIPQAFLLPDQQASKQKVLERLPCVTDYVRNARIFTLTEDYTFHLGVMGSFLVIGVLEGAYFILYLLIYIIKHLKSGRMSRSTSKLQIKFLIALLIQMLVPVLMMVIPLAYSAIVIIYDYYNQAYINIVVAIETMHGLISTLTMIFVHNPYRKALYSMLCSRCERRRESAHYQPNGSVFPTET